MQIYNKTRPLVQSLEPLMNEYTEEPSYYMGTMLIKPNTLATANNNDVDTYVVCFEKTS